MLRSSFAQHSTVIVLICSLVSFFSSAQTMYWIGGSGNFNDHHHWSFTSGGVPCNSIPSENNPVIFDDYSGKGFVSIAFGEYTKLGSLSVQNTGNKFVFTGTQTSTVLVSGSLHLTWLVDFRYQGLILFHSLNTQLHEVDFGNHELSSDVSFSEGRYRITSIQLSPVNTLKFGAGDYVIENTVVSVGNFINDHKDGRFLFGNAYIKVASDFKIKSEQNFAAANLYLLLNNATSSNTLIPLSLLSAKNFTSVNSTHVACPVTIDLAPACSGGCTGVLTISLSPTCTNAPYSVSVTNISCPSFAVPLNNSNIPAVYTVTNACACPTGNYLIVVWDASNTLQAFLNGSNFVPNTAVILDNNIAPCISSCNGSFSGVILGSSPFTVSIISSSATVSTFSTATGNYSVSNVCAGNYTFVVTDVYGCTALIPRTLTGASSPVIAANSGSICSGGTFSLSPSGATSYTITGGSSVVSPTVTSSFTVLGSGSGGCTGSVVSTVSVSPLPVISAPNGTICNGSSFTLSPSGALTYTYAGGNSIVSPSITSSYSVSGTSTNGCASGILVAVTVNQRPVLTVNSGSICSGSSFTMIPAGANTYTYSSGSAVVSPTSNTSYSVMGTSSFGCVSALSAISHVTVNPRPVISVNSGSVCLGSAFNISPTGALVYTISGGSTVVTPITNTNYSVTGTGVNGCITLTPAISSVTVVSSPVATITTNSPICEGKLLTMQAVAPGAYSYLWDGPFGYQSLLQNPGISPVSLVNNGIYTVTTLFNYGSLTCSTSAVHSVQVFPLPVIAAPNGTICVGQTFVINPVGAVSYVYSSGTPSVSPLVSSIYTVTGTAANSCTNIAIVNLSVNPLPVLQVNSGSICAGDSFTISPSGASSYTFSTGTAVLSPTSSLAYSVSGTNSLGCMSFSPATGLLVVYPAPSIYPYSTGSMICVGESATISAIGLPTYTWSNGLITQSIVVTPNQSTTFALTGTDSYGCSTTIQFVQNVDACLGLNSYNVHGSLRLYPNPFTDECVIESLEEINITLYNALGQFIFAQQLAVGLNRVDLSLYSDGIYFMRVKQDGASKTIKLVKE